MKTKYRSAACQKRLFACGSIILYRVCFPFLRSEAQKWKTKKRGKYRSAEGQKR
jgi:hypothetical protein